MLKLFTPTHPSLKPNGLHIKWKCGIFKWLFLSSFFKIRAHLPGAGKVIFGSAISLQGKLRISGPGTVIIEDSVIFSDNVDLYTHLPEAIIRIGKNSYINGARFSATNLIEIGPNNIIADVRILDTDFHWIHKDRMTDKSPPPTSPVKTANNVWVAAGSALLKGVRIGENSVVAFGSVVTAQIPNDEVWGGSPAKKIRDLPQPGEK
jgi:acetyltransferase-like isoleucine patch superfamily enzyme